ncbi:thioesterase family protein [Corynebacterium vitaeruminis]|uniref:thioesterase family protein n=1 Tax=Corynebacterium vitaeruminis TaxID=38305 RepID=UPI0023F72E48|nr:thioesterase family protein [Corynebacterium vitaeruminis]
MKDTLTPGLTHTMTYQVTPERTVPNLLPENPDFAAMPEVFATGYMVGVIEAACMEAMRPHLDEGEISLGTHVDLSHVAPTVPGSTVTIDVTLESIERRALTFSITARDEYAVISTGTHQRGVVNRERFVGRLPQ